MTEDNRFMDMALALARRGLGQTWPNPSVGCVLVRYGRVVGQGWTQPGGRPHAEAVALEQAGPDAQGATAYVTLEPCSHHGQTPPCADALIAAGIVRAVVALRDPDPRVDGKGVNRLRSAGVHVSEGVRAMSAREVNAGFLSRIAGGRPLVTLKVASTLDGRIATASGESRWITGAPARAVVHAMRAAHDAVMIGSNTALVDDPMLTCRLPGWGGRQPTRIVVDGRLRLPLTGQLVASARSIPTWLITLRGGDRDRIRAYRDAGAVVIEAAERRTGMLDLTGVMRDLAQRGLTRVLVEGGSVLAAGLLTDDLVDRVAWFRSPTAIGGDGLAALQALGVDSLERIHRFERVAVRPVADDILETYRRAES